MCKTTSQSVLSWPISCSFRNMYDRSLRSLLSTALTIKYLYITVPETKDLDLIKYMHTGTPQIDTSFIVDPEYMDHQKEELERRCCDLQK